MPARIKSVIEMALHRHDSNRFRVLISLHADGHQCTRVDSACFKETAFLTRACIHIRTVVQRLLCKRRLLVDRGSGSQVSQHSVAGEVDSKLIRSKSTINDLCNALHNFVP